MKRIAIAAMCAALGVVVLIGCGCSQGGLSAQSASSNSQSGSSQSPSASSSSSSVETIGSGATCVQVSNETGYDIVGVRIKPANAKQFTEENSFKGFDFADGSMVRLCFTEMPETQAYDIVLLTANDSKIGVRGVDLTHVEDITFRFEEGVGFVTFKDPQTGEGADTRDISIESELDSDELPSDLEGDVG